MYVYEYHQKHLPFFLDVSGDVTDNTVDVEVVEGAGISEKVKVSL
jgi:hypothetical protein